MVIGLNSRENDIVVNPMKGKVLNNMRTVLKDTGLNLIPPRKIDLEFALVFIDDDELVEVTPQNIRIRKKALKETDRTRRSRFSES